MTTLINCYPSLPTPSLPYPTPVGRIPVYLYEDFPWLPYEGSGYSPADLGYIVKGDHFSDVVSTNTNTICCMHN